MLELSEKPSRSFHCARRRPLLEVDVKLGLGRLSTMIRSKPPDCGTVELSDAAAGSSEGEDANHRMQSSVQPSPWPWFYFMIIANFLISQVRLL